jgi:hypothetical protein
MVVKSHLVLTAVAMCAAGSVFAAEVKKPEPPAYTTPESAPASFAIQGEYAGAQLGADVIAYPDRFHAVFFNGGLPGAGWDGSAKVEEDGKEENGIVKFSGAWPAELSGGKLSGKSDKGGAFELKRIVRTSPTEGAKPPAGAIVLFDGSNADAWNNGKIDDRKLLQFGTTTKQKFKDFTLHVEFILCFKPGGTGQGRSNSGVYLQDRYEVQVLDSFGLKGADNECGGLYHIAAPKVNMCFPPLQWQTYDIDFKAAHFDEKGAKTKNAMVTVLHNGVVIQENQEIPKQTGGGKPEISDTGPIQLQNHGNPVFYRNIWIVEAK